MMSAHLVPQIRNVFNGNAEPATIAKLHLGDFTAVQLA